MKDAGKGKEQVGKLWKTAAVISDDRPKDGFMFWFLDSKKLDWMHTNQLVIVLQAFLYSSCVMAGLLLQD